MNSRVCVLVGEEDPELLSSEEVHFSALAKMVMGSGDLGQGIVKVTNRRILFVPNKPGSPAVAFDYRSMVMHAVTSEQYIFIQLIETESEEEEERDDSEENIVKLYPHDPSQVGPLFTAINEMSALNPDEVEGEEEDGSIDFS